MPLTFSQPKYRSACAFGAAAIVAGLGFVALPAHAATFGAYSVTSFAAVGSESKPDDVTRLGDFIYVAFQNGVGSTGTATPSGVTASTVQQYKLDGTPVASWQVTGKVDGLTADPANNRLLLTTNEDGNSSFHTLTPGAATPLVDYTYVGLNHGGGTDAVSILNGTILVTASAPAAPVGTAATYSVQLSGTNANLTQVIADNSAATAINGPTANTAAPLALNDPDSNLVVPATVPTYGGDFLLDAQADQQLIFSANTGTPSQSLKVLSVTKPLDDTVFATPAAPVLWVTDQTHDTVDMVTGPFVPGEAITSVAPNDGSPTFLATVDLTTGVVTQITDLASINPKGLLFTAAAVVPAPAGGIAPAGPATPVTGSATFTG